MTKGMINIAFNVDAKGAISDVKAMGKATKSAGTSAKGWAKAGFFASAGAKAFSLSLRLLTRSLSTLLKPMKDSIFEMGVMGDKIAKQSRMIGVSAEQFQVMEYAATRSGTSLTAVTNGMKKLGRVMVDAQNGSRQIKDTFEALGITLKKDNGTLRETFDVFLDLADKSMILGESAERTGVQMLLLGRSGTEMSNLFAQGAKGILDLKQELVDLGGIMGQDALDNAENFVDKMADMEHAFRGVKIELGESLMPEFTNFAEQFATWLATTDFTEVKRLADNFLDMALGMVRAADALFDLKLFPKKETERLQDAANANEDLFNRVQQGSVDYKDLAASVRLFNSEQGEQLLLLAKQQKHGRAGKFTSLTPGAGPMKKTGDGLLVLREEFQLTADQIETFGRRLDELGGDAEAAALSMLDVSLVSEVQAGLLVLQANAVDDLAEAERKLGDIQKERAAAGSKEAKFLKEREEMILRERDAAKARITGIGDARKAEKAARDSARKAAQTELDFEKMTAEALARKLAGIEAYRSAAERLFDAFDRRDPGQVTADFEAGLIRENEFLELMGDIANETVRAQFEERKEIITQAYNDGVIGGLEVNALLSEADRIRHEERLRLEGEYWAIANEKQLEGMAAYGQALGAMSNMFSAFSDLVIAGYGEESAEAQRAANVMFVVSQALALGQAIMSMAVAIGKANELGYPLAVPAMIAAGATGAAQIATIAATTIGGLADAGLPPGALKAAGLNNHSLIAMRNDEMVLDPVGTKHITDMLMAQKAQMTGGTQEQVISTTVELDGQVLGSAVDKRLIRQEERGIPYSGRVRQGYMAV
jgi:hypothetical protein|tara:strand:+ start:1119 stop:3593 length:2475 start_codon:yes stop_codon:yes gene_type:complete